MFHFRRQKNTAIHHAIGVDVSDGSLEIVAIEKRKNGNLAARDFARTELPPNTIVNGFITDKHTLDEKFSDLLATAHLGPDDLNVIAALPDSQVIMKVVPLVHDKSSASFEALKSLAHKLYKQLGFNITHPSIQWKYIAHPHYGPQLTLFITRKRLIAQWVDFFRRHQMKLVVLEMESIALARALIRQCLPDENYAIVDFGYRQTALTIVDCYGIMYSHLIDGGGKALSELLSQKLNVSAEEAEKLKQSVGLAQHRNEQVATIIREHLHNAITAINSALNEYKSPTNRIILTGGGALTWGLKKMLGTVTRRKIIRGELWIKPLTQKNIDLNVKPISAHDDMLFSGAVGLALRGAERVAIPKGLNFIE